MVVFAVCSKYIFLLRITSNPKYTNCIQMLRPDVTDVKKFEFARRRLESGIVEFWRYASTHLKKLFDIDDAAAARKLAKEMLEYLTEHKRYFGLLFSCWAWCPPYLAAEFLLDCRAILYLRVV